MKPSRDLGEPLRVGQREPAAGEQPPGHLREGENDLGELRRRREGALGCAAIDGGPVGVVHCIERDRRMLGRQRHGAGKTALRPLGELGDHRRPDRDGVVDEVDEYSIQSSMKVAAHLLDRAVQPPRDLGDRHRLRLARDHERGERRPGLARECDADRRRVEQRLGEVEDVAQRRRGD